MVTMTRTVPTTSNPFMPHRMEGLRPFINGMDIISGFSRRRIDLTCGYFSFRSEISLDPNHQPL